MSAVTKEAIHLEVVRILNEALGKDLSQTPVGTPLRECDLDSMDVLDVVFQLEENYGIKIDDLALTRDSTIDDVLSLVEAQVKAKAA